MLGSARYTPVKDLINNLNKLEPEIAGQIEKLREQLSHTDYAALQSSWDELKPQIENFYEQFIACNEDKTLNDFLSTLTEDQKINAYKDAYIELKRWMPNLEILLKLFSATGKKTIIYAGGDHNTRLAKTLKKLDFTEEIVVGTKQRSSKLKPEYLLKAELLPKCWELLSAEVHHEIRSVLTMEIFDALITEVKDGNKTNVEKRLKESIYVDLANATDKEDKSPLHYAAQFGQLEIAKLLVKHGSNIRAITEDDKTPAELAHEHNHPALASYLNSLEHPSLSSKQEKPSLFERFKKAYQTIRSRLLR